MAHALSVPESRSDSHEPPGGSPACATAPADIAGAAFSSVEIHRDFAAVRGDWERLLPSSLGSAYQTYAFLKAWTDHAAAPEGVAPLIVVARDAAREPVALLPFGVKRSFGLRVAGFLGGSHVNFNLPVVRLDRLDRFAASETRRLLAAAAAAAKIDAFALVNQPTDWQGLKNPFAALPGQPAPDPAFSGPLEADADAHFRRLFSSKTRSKQRRKMRRFEELGAARVFRAEAEADRSRILDAYVSQKRAQLAARGIASVFDRPGVREFLYAACGVKGDAHAVDLYGFELDGEIIAATGALPHGERMSCMFNSIASGETAKYSPGELLLGHLVTDAINRGFRTFDLGVGAAPYKKMFCPDVDRQFDVFLGMTPQGRALASALGALRSAKTRIKANPKAYGLIEKARRLAAGRRGAEPQAATDDD